VTFHRPRRSEVRGADSYSEAASYLRGQKPSSGMPKATTWKYATHGQVVKGDLECEREKVLGAARQSLAIVKTNRGRTGAVD